MVTVEYDGRTGNNMFQYSFGRLVAELNGLRMGTKWCSPEFIRSTPEKPGRSVESPVEYIGDSYRDEHNRDFLSRPYSTMVVCDGFFQDHRIYDQHRGAVRSFWDADPVEVNTRDIVMHLRLGDYTSRDVDTIVHPGWFQRCLMLEGYKPGKGRKLYLVTDDPGDPYLRFFRELKPEVVSGAPREDFDFIRRFETVLCSPSTYCWWAVFLGHAKKVYSFPAWMRKSKYINLAYTTGFTPISGAFYSCRQHGHLKRLG